MAGACEPGLQQRAVGREREERQPDRYRKQRQQPERLARLRRRPEMVCDVQRQEEAGNDIHRDMDDERRPPGRKPRDEMRVCVARQQCGLEEHQRDRPDRGGAAQLRQHHLGEHRLHCKQQRCTDEDGCDERRQQSAVRRGLCRGPGVGRRMRGHAIEHGADAVLSPIVSLHHCRKCPTSRARSRTHAITGTIRLPDRPTSAGRTSPNSRDFQRNRPRTSTDCRPAPEAPS